MSQKVLFVDDEIEMCFMMSDFLKHYGYDVMTAETADQALELADKTPPNVIVLDVNLAGENGLQLVSFLHLNHPSAPIIIYTGMEHDDDMVKQAIKDGAHQYLRKGGPLDEIVKAVQSASE